MMTSDIRNIFSAIHEEQEVVTACQHEIRERTKILTNKRHEHEILTIKIMNIEQYNHDARMEFTKESENHHAIVAEMIESKNRLMMLQHKAKLTADALEEMRNKRSDELLYFARTLTDMNSSYMKKRRVQNKHGR